MKTIWKIGIIFAFLIGIIIGQLLMEIGADGFTDEVLDDLCVSIYGDGYVYESTKIGYETTFNCKKSCTCETHGHNKAACSSKS